MNPFSFSSSCLCCSIFSQIWVDADIVLALVFAEVENLKGAVV